MNKEQKIRELLKEKSLLEIKKNKELSEYWNAKSIYESAKENLKDCEYILDELNDKLLTINSKIELLEEDDE